MSGGTKYNNRFGNIEIYAVAKIELVMAFPGNRNANAAAWKDIFEGVKKERMKKYRVNLINILDIQFWEFKTH